MSTDSASGKAALSLWPSHESRESGTCSERESVREKERRLLSLIKACGRSCNANCERRAQHTNFCSFLVLVALSLSLSPPHLLSVLHAGRYRAGHSHSHCTTAARFLSSPSSPTTRVPHFPDFFFNAVPSLAAAAAFFAKQAMSCTLQMCAV